MKNRIQDRNRSSRQKPGLVVLTLAVLAGLLWSSSPAPAQDHPRCVDAVQGKIAWSYEGDTTWSSVNVRRLCDGALDSIEPARCFERVMHSGVDWGGGTRWEWQNALDLCRGTRDAEATISCFRKRVGGLGWQEAIETCRWDGSSEGDVGGAQQALTRAKRDSSNPITDAVALVGSGCTGTLVAPRAVVTAGHCVRHGPPIAGLPPTNDGGSDWELPGIWYPLFDYSGGLRIRFGNDRNNPTLTRRAWHYNHPGFADVIILGLEDPVPPSIAEPMPVLTDIPGDAEPRRAWRDQEFTMVGWGGTGTSSTPRFRRRATGTYGSYPHTSFGTRRPNQMLVKGEGGSQVMPGDSGGPLFWSSIGYAGSLAGRSLVGTAQGTESGGGRYFVTWGPGGIDGAGKERPDLGEWYEEVLRRGAVWTDVDRTPAAPPEDIAACHDGRIYGLAPGGALWVSRDWGKSRWTRVRELPNAETITCGAGILFFQKGNRELWYVRGDGELEKAGKPWAASTIAGTEDATLDFATLWALNDDRTLWVNHSSGTDGRWTSTGRPHAARDIAATQETLFAVNDDGSLWLNEENGVDAGWRRIGDVPDGTEDVSAASVGQTGSYRLIATTADGEVIRGRVERAGGIPERPSPGDQRTFRRPKYGDHRVDLCLEWGDRCGEPAADAFCKLRGYDGVVSHRRELDIGDRSPTYVIKAGRECRSEGCDGFLEITCRAS